jgi:hypothetical protein
MKEEDIETITEYVYKNYKWLKNKKLIIREKSNCFHIVENKDASPLILGKSIINKNN